MMRCLLLLPLLLVSACETSRGTAPILDETVPWNDVECRYRRLESERAWQCDVKAGDQTLLRGEE